MSAAPPAALLVASEPTPGLLHPLHVGVPVAIGRGDDVDLVLGHRSVSRLHARLEWEGAALWVVDLDSRNGVFVDGERVARRELAVGDQLRIGEVLLSVEAGDELDGLTDGVFHERTGSTFEPNAAPGSAAATWVAGPQDATQHRLRVLLRVARQLNTLAPVDGVLARVLELVFQVLPVDRAVVLVDDGAGALRPAIRNPARSDPFWSDEVVRRVVARGTAVLHQHARPLGDEPVLSSMAAPLQGRERPLGVLYVDRLAAPGALTPDDLDFLAAFANQVALALENAELLRRLEREAAARQSLLRFFPPNTAALVQGGRIEAVETEVTAMFADLSGYVELAASLPPLQVLALLDDLFPAVARIVFAHGGTLEKYIGDCVVAVWGAPDRRPDDADRALRAAREVLDAMDRRNADPGRVGPPVAFHVGLHTGLAAAGNIGGTELLQYAVIGDATNLAARACAAAGPGEIVFTEATLARLSSPPAHTVREGVPLKGKGAWRLCVLSRGSPAGDRASALTPR